MNALNVEIMENRDKIEYIGSSLIQHGKCNDRVYLIRYSENDDPGFILDSMMKLVHRQNYSKIFAKVPSKIVPEFLTQQFTIEAVIPRFYNGLIDTFFMSAFFDSKRKSAGKRSLNYFKKVLLDFRAGTAFKPRKNIPIIELQPIHAIEITKIFKKVFKSYPFPIHDPAYIIDTMKTHIRYFGVILENRLIAVSSAEIDNLYKNVEMTDFAVDPEFRGQKIACYLLYKMEKKLSNENIKTAYSITRLLSPAINITFLENGYKYSGTLFNNTNIAGKIESMNVFYKSLT